MSSNTWTTPPPPRRPTSASARPLPPFPSLPSSSIVGSAGGNMRHFARQGTGTTKLQFGPDSRKEGSAEAEGPTDRAIRRRWTPAPGGRDGAPPEDAFRSPTLLQLINYRQDSSEGGCDTARRKRMITAAMVVQLTAVGRTKIDIAFRCNIFHAQNMRCAVMHVSVYLCATPHPMPGARKQQCRQQGLSKCEPRLSFRVIDFSPRPRPSPSRSLPPSSSSSSYS